jgi:hypothetical protein
MKEGQEMCTVERKEGKMVGNTEGGGKNARNPRLSFRGKREDAR